jgi:glycerophosphoryl diester phosphodiesterase
MLKTGILLLLVSVFSFSDFGFVSDFELRASDFPMTPARKLILSGPRPLIIAHRGNSSEAPENTLPAFQSAVKLKTDFVELDYHTTADGVPVVIHDKTLDRTTNAVQLWGYGKLPIDKYKYDEIKALDAGSWRDPKFSAARLPTLEQALDVIQAGSMTMIEHKTGPAKDCVALLHKKKVAGQVIVQSFDWQFITECHKLDDNIVLGALGDKELTAAKLDQIAKTGATVVGWNQKHVTAREIEMIHARGYKAWVYTVDDEARAKELIAAGIDGIISNRPAKMLDVRRSTARP